VSNPAWLRAALTFVADRTPLQLDLISALLARGDCAMAARYGHGRPHGRPRCVLLRVSWSKCVCELTPLHLDLISALLTHGDRAMAARQVLA
jgi:hypothetical protein